jgi:hypothetical protein
MVSSGMLRGVALVRTDVSEELSSSFIRVTRILLGLAEFLDSVHRPVLYIIGKHDVSEPRSVLTRK